MCEDPGVHDLTPMYTGHIKISFPTDPQKQFWRNKNKIFWKHFANYSKWTQELCKRIKNSHTSYNFQWDEKIFNSAIKS